MSHHRRRGGFYGALLFEWRAGDYFATEREYAAGQRIAAHVHERPYVCIVTRGAYRERTPQGTLDCRRSTLLLHPAGTRHSDEFAQRASRCLVLEAPAVFDEPLVATSGPLTQLGGRIESELRVRDALTPLAIEGLLLETCALAMRMRTARPPVWLGRTLELLHDEPFRAHALRELATLAGVHPTHFARAFRKHAGMTAGEYVRRLRIERAKEAIASGRALAEIAASCGFSDQSHFTRTFRRIAGMTPAAFRRLPR